MTARDRFDALQAAWKAAETKAADYRGELSARHRNYHYAPIGARKRLDALTAAADKRSERFYSFLDSLSPRNWRSGVPCSFVRDVLTFDDATTIGALSVVPPAAYGYGAGFVTQFAAALAR